MTRRWLGLLAIVAVAALLLGVLARRAPAPAPARARAAAIPGVELALEISGGAVRPEAAAVPQGHRVRLCVRNGGGAPVDLRLAGYEDRVRLDALAPGETRCDSFVADRPGDDFAWLVAGRPAGRLSVTGSHLVEGHR